MIIDTDAGGDPDDTLAIALACRLPNVLAFVTSDETADGARARFVRSIVGDSALVLTGLPSPHPGKHVLDELRVSDIEQPPAMQAVLPELLRDVVRDGDMHWVGIGSYTNLAWLFDSYPALAQSMKVTLMGGRLNHSENDRPEHNFKVDPDAAMKVAEAAHELVYVPTTVTTHDQTRIDRTHPLISYLEAGPEPWKAIVLANFDIWFRERFPASYQHDALTLGIALGAVPYTRSTHVRASRPGGLIEDPSSSVTAVAGGVDYDTFWRWVWHTLN
jgi:inosine-uridine nucleoside N-ribohydrolase